jgi:hypothetical protein
MVFRLALLVMATSMLLTVSAQQPTPVCCQPESENLSQEQVKALVKNTEPIRARCCADLLRISGTIVLTISVDAEASITCVRMISGLPLAAEL